MDYPQNEIDELKKYCSELSHFTEAGHLYFRMKGVRLPAGCLPEVVEVLYRPKDDGVSDGYPNKLYFPQEIKSSCQLNWHVQNLQINRQSWFSFSWKIDKPNATLAEGLLEHLKPLVRNS